MLLARATSLRLAVAAVVFGLCTAVASAQMDSMSGSMPATDAGSGFIGVLIVLLIPIFGIAIGVVSMMVDKMLRGTH